MCEHGQMHGKRPWPSQLMGGVGLKMDDRMGPDKGFPRLFLSPLLNVQTHS